ncbi:hypothetical protein ACT2CC_00020 [Candidatus Vidania fulgoroideorum]
MIIKSIFDFLKKSKNKKTININFVLFDKNNFKFERYLILPNRIKRSFRSIVFCKNKDIKYCKKIGYSEVYDPIATDRSYFDKKKIKYILCQHEVYSIFKKKFLFFLNKKKIRMSYDLGNIFKDFKYLNFFKLGYITFIRKNLNYINTYFSDSEMCFKKFYENLVFVFNFIKNNFKIKKIFISSNNSKSFELDININ